MQSHQFRAMNTVILLEAEGPEAAQAFDTAQSFIEISEQRFTRFKETSELSALNRSAGNWFSASSEMMELMTTAMHCHKATGGLFDPSVLPYLEAAGYTQSMDQLWLLGPNQQPEHYPHKGASPFTAVEIDKTKNRIRLPKDMKIDLGGIAKGWIAEKAAKLMAVTLSRLCCQCWRRYVPDRSSKRTTKLGNHSGRSAQPITGFDDPAC